MNQAERNFDGGEIKEAILECLRYLDGGNRARADTNALDVTVSVLLEKVASRLSELGENVSSANVPYRKLREIVFNVTQRTASLEPDDWKAACCLYVRLVTVVPIAYDEAVLSSVISLMTGSLKQTSSRADEELNDGTIKSKSRKKKGVVFENPSDSTFRFWKLLLELLSTEVFVGNFRAVGQATANSFAQLFVCASFDSVRRISTSAFKLLTHEFGIVYKSLLPVAISGLRGALKSDFITLVKDLFNAEKNALEDRVELDKRLSTFSVKSRVSTGTTEGRRISCSSGASQSSRKRSRKSFESVGSRSDHLELVGFLLHCISKVPEKVDDRRPVAELVSQCIPLFEKNTCIRFVQTLHGLARHTRPTVRLFVCELSASLMTIELEADDSRCLEEAIISILFDGLFDKAPVVRVKSLTCLAELLRKLTLELSQYLISKLVEKKEYLNTLEFDEKVTVRKAFVHFVGSITREILPMIRPCTSADENTVHEKETPLPPSALLEWMGLIQSRTKDSANMVRKAAITELHETTRNILSCTDRALFDVLIEIWKTGVVARAVDDEPACQEKAADSFKELFLDSLSEEGYMNQGESSSWHSSNFRASFLDNILSTAGNASTSLSECIATLMKRIAKKEGVPLTVLQAFQARICRIGEDVDSNEALRDGTWALFAECLQPNIANLARYKLSSNEIYEKAVQECSIWSAPVASFFADELGETHQENSINELTNRLFEKARWNDIFWRKSVRAIIATIAGINKENGSRVLERCEALLHDAGKISEDNQVEQLTLIAIIGDSCTKLQLSCAPSPQILNFVLAMASTKQTSSAVRASSILALCRICLGESGSSASAEAGKQVKARVDSSFFEGFARTCIPLFVRELQDGTTLAVRNNCIIALSELCRRFTSIVELYATRIAARLADREEIIRCHVLGAIGSLLQEDYLKVRGGPVFFRIALSLLDDSVDVRTMAKYILTKILHHSSQTLLSISIIELVYVLNGSTEHVKYNQFPKEHIGWDRLCKCTYARKYKRSPYDVFMSVMTQDQILLLSSRICSEILTPAVDGKLTVTNPNTSCVLSDALYLLQKVQRSSLISVEFGEQATILPKSSQTSESSRPRTKADLIRTVRLAELKNKLVPLLLELRCILESERSPILVDVRHTLCAILKPHRKHLNDILTDPVVLGEIEHLYSRQRDSNEMKNLRRESEEMRARERDLKKQSQWLSSENSGREGASDSPKKNSDLNQQDKKPVGDKEKLGFEEEAFADQVAVN